MPWAEYVDALRREVDLRFPERGAWVVDTLYLGGGTPSHLGGEGVARLLEALRARVTLADGAEVTLEANPEDIDDDAVRAWRDAGVNRLSIGAQSFDDSVLRWMHRTHDAATTARAVEIARRGGLDNFSLDLIFALPESIERSWRDDVQRALDLGPSHLSLYGLTIEPHTPLGRWRARGDVHESPEERYEEEFLYAHSTMLEAGFEHYEVSNFGRPGARARHNSSYWSGVPYAGLGPSAHEFDGGARRWNVAAYADWDRRLGDGIDPIADREELGHDSQGAERVYLGLRTTDGLVLTDAEVTRVAPWISAGWGNLSADNRLTLTALGWLRLDALATDLTLVRSHY